MPNLNQKGVAHLFLLVILVAGLIAGVILVQSKGLLSLRSKASSSVNPYVSFPDLSVSKDGVPYASSSTIKVQLTSPIGSGKPCSDINPVLGVKTAANNSTSKSATGNQVNKTSKYKPSAAPQESSPASQERCTIGYRIGEYNNFTTGYDNYSSLPTTASYTFKDKTLGRKYLFVQFLDLNNNIQMVNLVPVDLLAPTLTPIPIIKDTTVRLSQNSYIKIDDPLNKLVLAKDFTIEVWAKVREPERMNMLFSRSYNSKYPNYLWLFEPWYGSQNIVTEFLYGESDGALYDPLVPVQKWFHFAIRKQSNLLQGYLDGRKVYEVKGVGVPTTNNIQNTVLIGASNAAGFTNSFFNGDLYDLRISDNARDVEKNWRDGVYAKSLTADSNTVALWSFRTDVKDSGSNHLDGQIQGNVVFVDNDTGEIEKISVTPIPTPTPSTPIGSGGFDLDVGYIERLPKYPGYRISYYLDRRMCAPDNPHYYPFPEDRGPVPCPDEATKKHWPANGDTVTFKAKVLNKGIGSSQSFIYKWFIDGLQVDGGENPPLGGGGAVFLSYNWKWQPGDHKIRFLVMGAGGEELKETYGINNQREDYINALAYSIHVEDTVYQQFNQLLNLKGTKSFEDWLQAHVDKMNQKIQTSGGQQKSRIDEIIIDSDGTLPRGGTHTAVNYTADGHWGFETSEWCLNPNPKCKNDSDNSNDIKYWVTRIQPSLIHEWTHQLGMAHSYDANVNIASNNLISNQRLLQLSPDIVGLGGDDVGYAFSADVNLTPYFIDALNSNLGFRRGYYGEYLFDVPNINLLQVNSLDGIPLTKARVKIWQSADNIISGNPVYAGTTDYAGKYVIPNRNMPGNFENTTLTGHTLKANPFGVISVIGRNGLLLIEITPDNSSQKYYKSLTVHDFNLAYQRGNRQTATYVLILP